MANTIFSLKQWQCVKWQSALTWDKSPCLDTDIQCAGWLSKSPCSIVLVAADHLSSSPEMQKVGPLASCWEKPAGNRCSVQRFQGAFLFQPVGRQEHAAGIWRGKCSRLGSWSFHHKASPRSPLSLLTLFLLNGTHLFSQWIAFIWILFAVSCLVFKTAFVCLHTLLIKSFLAVCKNSHRMVERLWRGKQLSGKLGIWA